jgi:beta-1,4-N-acetylglucosaminyltransferase
MRVFITVGTTEFDELISSLDSAEAADALVRLGATTVVLQVGRGVAVPQELQAELERRGVSCSWFKFRDTLSEEMEAAELIISHCGAGSVLEATNLRKLLLLVVNPTLQGNHQDELASAMKAGNYCFTSTPTTLLSTLRQIEANGGLRAAHSRLSPFPTSDPKSFPALVDSLFDWH